MFTVERIALGFSVTLTIVLVLFAVSVRSFQNGMGQTSDHRQLMPVGLESGRELIMSSGQQGEDFEIEAFWIGDSQWMSGVDNGYETFGGSMAKGVDFFGSTIRTTQFVPVEIRFDSNPANQTLVQTFRRDQFFPSAGVGSFPGSAWDMIDTANPRRLNLCIVEYDDGNGPLPPPNLQWDPDTSQFGKFEYLFVMNSGYDSTGETYADSNILLDDMDVLYAWWPRVADGHMFFESEPAALKIVTYINLKTIPLETSVILTWVNPGPQPTKFRIFWSNTSPPDELLVELPGSINDYVHDNLVSGQQYYYIIKSYDQFDNEIIISREVTVTTRELPPVASVFPLPQIITAQANTPIIVTFDTPMAPATINSSTMRVFGRWSGPTAGSYIMENGNTQVRFVPSEPFFAGEWVTVSLSKGVNTQAGVPFITGYSWNFWVATKKGTLDLREIAQIPIRLEGEPRIRCYGAYAGDLNDDTYSDLAIVNEDAADVRVLLNDGAGNYTGFTIYALPGAILPSANEGADFNGDAIIDLAVGTLGGDEVRVLRGDGLGGFLPQVSYTANVGVGGVGVIDLNGDGADDIVTTNRIGSDLSILMNNGDGTFAPTINIETSGNGEHACVIADANGDGILDVFVGAETSGEVILLTGDGNGGLNISAKVSAGGQCWMMAVGDVNLDGFADVVSANFFSNNFSVILGDGLGGLVEAVTYPTSNGPLAIDLGDIDGDGDLDMAVTCFSSNEFILYENAGDGTFINPRIFPGSSGASCCILHDRDNDGDLDMSATDELDDILFLFDNSCCFGNRGDVNGDGTDANILDLTYLVDRIFRGGPPADCDDEADLNGDGTPSNILDLTFLVDRIFRGGGPAGPC